MFSKSIAVLALATGLAAAKPVNVPQSLPVYKRAPIDAFGNGVSINNQNGLNQGFDFIGGFNQFNQQQQVLQVQQQNFQLVNNNGVQQQVFEQVNQVLVVDNQRNGFNNDLNNLFRTTNVRNNNRDVTVVMMVVTQVNVAVADNRGNQIQQQVFAQSILVANRGQRQTQSVMIFDSRTLIAQDIIGNGNNNGINNNGINLIGGNGVAAPTGGAVLPTKTRGVQILGAKPTWSSVIEDPAQTNGVTWEAELQALQQADQDGADNELNNQVAQQLKDAQNNQQNQDQQNQDQQNQDQQQQQDAQAADKNNQ